MADVGKFAVSPCVDPNCHVLPSIEELYPTAVERENKEGHFLEIMRSMAIPAGKIPPFSHNQRRLQRTLELVRGVGACRARECRRRGTITLTHLIYNYPRIAPAARQVKFSLDSSNYFQMTAVKSLKDVDFIHCFHLSDLLFVDIETLGFFNQPIFLIATGAFSGAAEGEFTIRQLFARDISEEAAILSAFIEDLPDRKCLVSYNGKTFDLTILRARSAYYFDEDFYTPPHPHPDTGEFTGLHHIDLFHVSRRLWKHEGLEDFRLGTIEKYLLGLTRGQGADIMASEIPRVYRAFLADPADAEDIQRAIEHNYADVLSLALLLGKVLQTLFSTK